MTRVLLTGLVFALIAPAAAPAAAQPIGIVGGDAALCRPGAAGSAVLIDVAGLKDRSGTIRAELYPATKDDFLATDTVLEAAGKTFRRVTGVLPETGPVQLCVKTPGPGNYAIVVVQQRGTTRKFNLNADGVGFSNNPRLRWSSPSVESVTVGLGAGINPLTVVMNYFQGLSMRPLPQPK